VIDQKHYFSCLDHILQHLWINLKQPYCPHNTYEELIYTIRLTERDWNTSVPLNKTLRYLSLVANANINIVRFKKQKKEGGHPGCLSSSLCSTFKYQFQNGVIKLLFKSDFHPLVLIEHKKMYYILKSVSIAPFLINEPRTTAIHYQGFSITQSHILNILRSDTTPHHFPFSIALYTSFSFTNQYHQKINQTHLIGWYQGTNTTLHLFLTPSLENVPVYITYLDGTNSHKKMVCLKNIYSLPHLTEGNHHSGSKKAPETLLNQNFCICAHSKTSQFSVPSNHTFKPLGGSTVFYSKMCILFSLPNIKFFLFSAFQWRKTT
jgi:hypothetical protein